MVKALTFTHDLADLSNDNQALVTAFQKDKTTGSLYDIALTLPKQEFMAKVENTSPDEDDKAVSLTNSIRNSIGKSQRPYWSI